MHSLSVQSKHSERVQHTQLLVWVHKCYSILAWQSLKNQYWALHGCTCKFDCKLHLGVLATSGPYKQLLLISLSIEY
jgi:hypothetical protein